MSDIMVEAQRLLDERVRAYKMALAFESPAAKEVLKDLAKFCRAHESSFNPDPRVHALLEGRREVWLRIQNYIQLTNPQIWELLREENDGTSTNSSARTDTKSRTNARSKSGANTKPGTKSRANAKSKPDSK